jgi:hypothetical protein
MRQIRGAIGAAAINPALLTVAERIQYEGYLRREETNAVIVDMDRNDVTIKEIVRRTGHSRGLVRNVLRASVRTCSEFGRVRLSRICNGSTNNGRRGNAMAQSCGGGSRSRGSEAAHGSYQSGRRGVGGQKRRTGR